MPKQPKKLDELFHDTLETREVMRQMFRFARFHLAGTAAEGVNV